MHMARSPILTDLQTPGPVARANRKAAALAAAVAADHAWKRARLDEQQQCDARALAIAEAHALGVEWKELGEALGISGMQVSRFARAHGYV